eukprot:466931-Prymnesium_polylepis.1
MSRQQKVVCTRARARGTARLRRADRRGAACGRAGRSGIARGAAGRGPALRHSCVSVAKKSTFSRVPRELPENNFRPENCSKRVSPRELGENLGLPREL